ncbi:TetR/AcrR family transcriptional regulator [Affinibrenneria salicis]|uniref:TetR/AcrR family transcriptional regulator n=1 Tax=Affinibrenneria salicis TaxID=2590031 RepID=A0A5J5G354_9GAMM|nr:TetR/AcrR family transcriptional regulator [Affinibrenneria salicis]KAA9001335.1 TetR/AcrR family transcriptional regulator [Affinibrenneria salicis]
MENVKQSGLSRRGRPKAIGDDERRRSIIMAAYGAFIELGFSRTTTAVIAARARVSKRALYQFFSSKTELFAAVIGEHQHLILDLPRPEDETLPLLDTLIAIFRLDIDQEAEREREAILNLMVRESVLFPELSDYLYEKEVIRSQEALIEWLQREAQRGRMTVGDARVCAGMLMDIVFGALLPRRRLRQAPDRALRTEHIKKRLAIFLRGIQDCASVHDRSP